MARPKKDQAATADFAKHVARLRRRHRCTAKDLELWTYVNLDTHVAEESFRKAFAGTVDPSSCSLELLMALTGFFGVGPEELGPYAAARFRPVNAWVQAGGGDDGPGGQVIASSTWEMHLADQAA